jgi:PAS domain S-box-containing protein
MWVLKTSDHKFLSVNQAAINHYGYSREEFYNLTAADIRPPEDKESYLQHRITQHIGPHQEGIWKHRKKDGSLITVEIFADDIVYDNQPARLILANDITEKQKAEEETAKSEIRFRNTLDKMLEGVQIYDCNWNCLYLNDAVTKQGPYSKEEVMARSMLENYPGIEQTELFKIFQECIANDKARHIEYEFTFPDLSKKWFELSLQPIPEGLFILSIDITERKKVEEDLRLSLKEISDYKYALDESSIVAITDQKGIIHYANENFCKISKYTHDELIGQDHRIVNSGYHPKEFIRNLWKTISGGHIWRGELKNKAKDGTIYWVDTTIVPFLNEHNKPYQYVAIRADITERKKAEEDLLQLNEQLRNLTAHLQTIRETERTNMAREIHDELGQQLTSLKMDISWLKNKTKTESPHINQKTDGMLEIINDAIRTVRKIVVALRPGILDDLGLEAALEWQAKEFEQRAGIHCFFKASVTHEKFSQQINTTVFRIFQEALTNVMRYANATEVKAELYESNDELILKIKDNGIGIDDADKNKKTSFGLMGMKERASMLHGEFSVDKLPEGGTGITLKIPLQL